MCRLPRDPSGVMRRMSCHTSWHTVICIVKFSFDQRDIGLEIKIKMYVDLSIWNYKIVA
jgi:hypothetical protein